MSDLKQNADKIRQEMEAKQLELEQIQHEMWIADIIHPKPEKVNEWKDDSPMYTPTVEQMIARTIVDGDFTGKDNYAILFSKIKSVQFEI